MRSSHAARTSAASSSPISKFISLICAVTLCCGLVPSSAFAADDSSLSLIPEGDEGVASIASSAEGGDADGFSHYASDDASSADGSDAATSSEDVNDIEDEQSILATKLDIINRVEPLQAAAKKESTRSFFLAQTLETTHTVSMLSASLPIDSAQCVVSADSGGSSIASISTVVGSFEYLGMAFAIEPGGESVILVAADYFKLPQQFIENQVLVIPESATPNGIDYYPVTRIADYAFVSLSVENAYPDYVSCRMLMSDEELLSKVEVDRSEVKELLNNEVIALQDGRTVNSSSSTQIRGEVYRDESGFDGKPDANRDEAGLGYEDEKSSFSTESVAGILVLALPSPLIDIGDDAFTGFDTLRYIVASSDGSAYCSYYGCLYTADSQELVCAPDARSAIRLSNPNATVTESKMLSLCSALIADVVDSCSNSERPFPCIVRNESSFDAAFSSNYPDDVFVASSLDRRNQSGNSENTDITVYGPAAVYERLYHDHRAQPGLDDKWLWGGFWKNDGWLRPHIQASSFAWTDGCISFSGLYECEDENIGPSNHHVYFGVTKDLEWSYDLDVGGVTSAWLVFENVAGGIGAFYMEQDKAYSLKNIAWVKIYLNECGVFDITWDDSANPYIDARHSWTTSGYKPYDLTAVIPQLSAAHCMFKGWAETPSGEAAIKRIGGERTTYYSIWEEEEFDVIFDEGAGTFASSWNQSSARVKYISETITAPTKEQISRPGYTLAGWSTNANPANADSVSTGTGRIAAGGTTNVLSLYGGAATIPSTITLYPVWSVDAHKITLNPDGGAYDDAALKATLALDASKKAGLANNVVTYTVLTPAFTIPSAKKAGWSFSGWQKSGASNANPTVSIDSSKTLEDTAYKALWSKNSYLIKYYEDAQKTKEASFASDASTVSSFDVDGPSLMTIPTPVRKGWKFTGWSGPGLSNGSNTVNLKSIITNELPKSPVIALEYVANWEQDAYTVSYILTGENDNYLGTFESDYKGFNGAAPTKRDDRTYVDTYRFDENGTASVLQLPNKTNGSFDLSRPGYVFAGWVKSGTDFPVTQIDPRVQAEDIMLEARWTPVPSLAVPIVTTPETVSVLIDRATGRSQEDIESSLKCLTVHSTTPVDCTLTLKSEKGGDDLKGLFETMEEDDAPATMLDEIASSLGLILAFDGTGLVGSKPSPSGFLPDSGSDPVASVRVQGSEQYAAESPYDLCSVDVGTTLKLAQQRTDGTFGDLSIDVTKVRIKELTDPLQLANLIWTVSLS